MKADDITKLAAVLNSSVSVQYRNKIYYMLAVLVGVAAGNT